MDNILWIILLIINILLYGGICFVILKKKMFTSISIRSPKLLILNNIGNLFMSIIIIVSNFFNDLSDFDKKKIVSTFYYLTNFLLIIPYILRLQRILKCCEIKSEEKLDLQELYSKKYLYQEKYYIKFTLILWAILLIILIISESVTMSSLDKPITPFFLYYNPFEENNFNLVIWLAINFIEHIILLTYAYKICIYQLKQKLRFEVISCFLLWLIYSNLVHALKLIEIEDIKIYSYISLAVCYLLLIINSVIPILISISYKYSTIYHFTPKLMNNLYLFLSNEACYAKFKNYLQNLHGDGIIILNLYTKIMNYKLGFKLNIETAEKINEGNDIKNEYFNDNHMDNILSKDVVDKVKNECNKLNNNQADENIFDKALKCCYNKLGTHFKDFVDTDDYKRLYDDFYLTSYIQCKMVNVGLIDKF